MPRTMPTENAPALVPLNAKVSADLRKRIKIAAASSDRTMPEIVVEALEQYLKGQK